MKVGNAHEFERFNKDGLVIQMRAIPIEGGGFVTASPILPHSVKNETVLEERVNDRTQQLANALTEQKWHWNKPTRPTSLKVVFGSGQSRPAATDACSTPVQHRALEQSVSSTEDQQTLQQLDRALYGAESILSALLDIARLEGGTIQPKRQAYSLHDLLNDLELQFKSICRTT